MTMHSQRFLYRRVCTICKEFLAGHVVPSNHLSTSAKAAAAPPRLLERDFSPKNILLLRKITRYEYEKSLLQTDNEEQLKTYLTEKGSDYASLLARHVEYQQSIENLHECLVKHGLSVELVCRQNYTTKNMEKADAIFTAGGDGTFLMAASNVKGHGKPVIGINTDPIRSEGVLCLPKQYSQKVNNAIQKILDGKFRWMYRQRIRITMSGRHSNDDPVSLHDEGLKSPEHRFTEHVKENEMFPARYMLEEEPPERILPTLALNDVFIGESLSARMSFYEMSVDHSPVTKLKSSGLTVCTGTGSTSWYFNTNHVPQQSVKAILSIWKEMSQADVPSCDAMLIQQVTRKFNSSLVFDPRDLRMAYTVRDPVPHGIFQVSNPRGFCNSISVKSRMWDACLVVDGGLTFRFNDGARVTMDMHEEDALRCVQLI